MANQPMDGPEFDEYMDGLTIRNQNSVLGVKYNKYSGDPPLGDGFHRVAKRLALRLIWLAAWAWLIFTFGWVGHVAIRLIEKQKEWGKKDESE